MSVEITPMLRIELTAVEYVAYETGDTVKAWTRCRRPNKVLLEVTCEEAKTLWNKLGRDIREAKRHEA